MGLENLKKTPGSTHSKTIVGRGYGSKGKTSGRGHKGQKARSGGGVRRGFEGGQTPLYRRLPKRGFKNIHAKNYTEVTLTMLDKSKSEIVTQESLIKDGIINNIVKNNHGYFLCGTNRFCCVCGCEQSKYIVRGL